MGRNAASNGNSVKTRVRLFSLSCRTVVLPLLLSAGLLASGSAFAQLPKAPVPSVKAGVSVTAPAAPTVGVAVTPPAVPTVGVAVSPPGVTPPTVTAAVPGAAAPAGVAAAAGASVATGAAPALAVPAGTAPAVAPVAGPGEKPLDGATYAIRLRDLEASVDELKDRIRRSHTRLALLSDTILSGGAAGSRADISVDNEMSSAFRLTKALVVLDGAVQYNRADESGALADQKSIPVFSGSVPPGDHTLQVVLSFQGNGYGVFSYLRSYHWDLKSSHSFTAVEGKTLTLTATALEKGGVTTPLDQRPAVEWKEKVQSLAAANAANAAAGAPPAAPGAAPAPAAGTSK